MTHIIQQVFLDIGFRGSEVEALALQRRLSLVCHDIVFPALEKSLDKISPAEGRLCIDFLELDAGVLSLDRLEQGLAESITRALERSVGTKAHNVDNMLRQSENKVTHQSTLQTHNEVFIHFLKTGILPWSFRLPENKTLEQVLTTSWKEEIHQNAEIQTFKEQFLKVIVSPVAQKRLILQFSPDFHQILLYGLVPESYHIIVKLLQTLKSENYPTTEHQIFERILWKVSYAQLASRNSLVEKYIVLGIWHILTELPTQNKPLQELIARHWPDVKEYLPEKNHLVEIPGDLSESQFPPASTKAEYLTEEKPKASPFIASGNRHSAEETETSTKTNDLLKNETSKEGIYIDNAGLVILHAFLPQIFEALDLAVGNKILKADRALCLLNYLTTGQKSMAEYDLVLAKLLCNIPVAIPVACLVVLSETELAEANNLLEAVITHWEALRNTTPDGLRTNFLMRPGKLSIRNDTDWLLQVEPKSWDVLLDHLPWGIGMIKLPWMENLLWVEWRF